MTNSLHTKTLAEQKAKAALARLVFKSTTTLSMAKPRTLRALMFPLPLQGHLTPCINLALKLASKGLAITFVNFEHVHCMLSKAHNSTPDEFNIFSEAYKSGLEVRYITIDDGLPLEFDRVLHHREYYEYIMREFTPVADEFVGSIIRSDPLSTYFLIVDTMFSWQDAVADKYDLVHVSFWTEPAMVFSLVYHSELLREKGHYPLKDGVEENIDYVPGIQSVNTKDFMPYLKESEIETISYKILYNSFVVAKKADFVLHNTVQELEPSTLSALNKYQPHYPIGPTNFYKNLPTNSLNNSLLAESDCTLWLESKLPGTVLYVSFGSLVQASKQIIEEIANGLILSQVNFIWVARDGITGNMFPAGFEDRIKDRGLIVPWCNQIMVLTNPAVGGFLSHCGWNSVLESIWCGTPMLCYPIDFDQPINRRQVVEDWGIGFSLCDRISVDKNEVAEKIKAFMTGDASKAIRHQIISIKEKLRNAIETDGSSERNLDQFLATLNETVYTKSTIELTSII